MSKEMKNIKVPSYMKEMGEGMFAGMGWTSWYCTRCGKTARTGNGFCPPMGAKGKCANNFSTHVWMKVR